MTRKYSSLGPSVSLRATPRWSKFLSSAATNVSKFLVVSVAIAAAIITAVSVHNLYPVEDPITPIGYLDRLSLLMGVHQQSAVVVIDVGLFGSTVYAYVFHRHVSDGSFHVAFEEKKTVLPGLLDGAEREPDAVVERRAREMLKVAADLVPEWCFHAAQESSSKSGNPPLIAKVDPSALRAHNRKQVKRVVSILNRVFLNSTFALSPNGGSVGTLSSREERVLQWFAVNLLTHGLRSFSMTQTAVIADVGAKDVDFTFAVSSSQKAPVGSEVRHVDKLSAFGRSVKLLTVRYPGLGLHSARFEMLTSRGIGSNATNDSEEEQEGFEAVHSECMNPITDAHWTWNGRKMHIKGKKKPDYELVKERNGPFAGKRVNHPVANYDQCHALAKNFLEAKLGKNASDSLRSMFRSRHVFMEGLLLEKSMERGLTLPYRGGDVLMKSFIDSLTHACKVPNTDQPFGCVDLMYLASFVDSAFGFKQSNKLRSGCNVGGMAGEWPLAAAFYVYENGL